MYKRVPHIESFHQGGLQTISSLLWSLWRLPSLKLSVTNGECIKAHQAEGRPEELPRGLAAETID